MIGSTYILYKATKREAFLEWKYLKSRHIILKTHNINTEVIHCRMLSDLMAFSSTARKKLSVDLWCTYQSPRCREPGTWAWQTHRGCLLNVGSKQSAKPPASPPMLYLVQSGGRESFRTGQQCEFAKTTVDWGTGSSIHRRYMQMLYVLHCTCTVYTVLVSGIQYNNKIIAHLWL